MLGIWEQRTKEKLPLHPIIPMIIYHGQDKWQIRSFEEYFEGKLSEELLPFIPRFEYLLTNLQARDAKEIRQQFQYLNLQMAFFADEVDSG